MIGHPSRFPSPALALAALLAGFAPATSAIAAVVFTVDYSLDEVDDNPGNGICHSATNHCSLRAAVMEATTVVGNDTIIVLPAGTYSLTLPASVNLPPTDGPLKLTPPASGNPTLSIIGAGAALSIIDVGASLRAFTVSRPARLVGLTIRNGQSQAPLSGVAGAISNLGVGGVLVIDGCVLSGNQALGNGGTTGKGGAIFNSGTLTLERSTVIGNSAAAEGGGVYNEVPGTLYVRNSTISNNSSQGTGGGIENKGLMVIAQGTISTNLVNGQGGGIHNLGNANVYNTTIALNQAGLGGGANPGSGVYNTSVFNVRNTLLVGNVRPSAIADDCAGTVATFGNNAFSGFPGSCVVTQNGAGTLLPVLSLAELGALQDNGGPSRTHALVVPSALIDGGDPNQGCVNEGSQTLVVDQRGFPRSAGARCDLGAYESGAPGGQPFYEDGFEPDAAPVLVINEVDYDQPGTDSAEFIEIRNNGAQSANLAGLALVLVNGSNGAEYARIDLGPAGMLPAGGYLVVRSPGVIAAPSALTLNFAGVADQVQNGAPDGIALIQVSPPLLLDALSYEGSVNAAQIGGFAGTVDLVEGVVLSNAAADSDSVAGSLCRFPDGQDTNQANTDWTFRSTPTPGLANQ